MFENETLSSYKRVTCCFNVRYRIIRREISDVKGQGSDAGVWNVWITLRGRLYN